ncbi:MAG: hypothetical protein ABUS79_01755 [Pseudomonadota bacterium]
MSRLSFTPLLGPALLGLLLIACGTGASPGGGAGGGRSGEATGGNPGGAGAPANGSGGRGDTGGAGAAATGGAGAAATGGAGAAATGGAPGSAGRLGSGGQGGRSTAPGGQGGGPAQGGAGAGAGAGGSAKAAATPSAGCGTPTGQALNQWVDGMVTSAGASRAYAVRLPTGYDASRAYPVIVLLHGCTSGTNNVPMEKVTGTDAILVRGTGSAANTCWTTSANGADVAFFDAMVADVKARFCADQGRFFVVGYSSGSWLANQLTCIRSTVLRGAATVTGGEAASGTCTGPVARMFIHDKDDTENVISGSERARDRMLTQNGCDKAMPPVAQDPPPCAGYSSCPAGYPVVWCATSGNQHGRQDTFAPGAFWNFFKQF